VSHIEDLKVEGVDGQKIDRDHAVEVISSITARRDLGIVEPSLIGKRRYAEGEDLMCHGSAHAHGLLH